MSKLLKSRLNDHVGHRFDGGAIKPGAVEKAFYALCTKYYVLCIVFELYIMNYSLLIMHYSFWFGLIQNALVLLKKFSRVFSFATSELSCYLGVLQAQLVFTSFHILIHAKIICFFDLISCSISS